MRNKQITITCPNTDILQELKNLKSQKQINISAYCCEAIRQKMLNDKKSN